jgi:hypothetical protein
MSALKKQLKIQQWKGRGRFYYDKAVFKEVKANVKKNILNEIFLTDEIHKISGDLFKSKIENQVKMFLKRNNYVIVDCDKKIEKLKKDLMMLIPPLINSNNDHEKRKTNNSNEVDYNTEYDYIDKPEGAESNFSQGGSHLNNNNNKVIEQLDEYEYMNSNSSDNIINNNNNLAIPIPQIELSENDRLKQTTIKLIMSYVASFPNFPPDKVEDTADIVITRLNEQNENKETKKKTIYEITEEILSNYGNQSNNNNYDRVSMNMNIETTTSTEQKYTYEHKDIEMEIISSENI